MKNCVTCPNCHHKFPLDEAFSKEMEAKSVLLEKKYSERESALKAKELAQEELIKKAIEAGKAEMWEKAQKVAEERKAEEFHLKIRDLEAQNKERNEKLKEAQEKELELRKQARTLEEREKNLELEKERQLDLERKKIAEKVKADAEEDFRKQLAEKDQKMLQYEKNIEALQRKKEQGSMQLQGDAQENDLKSALSQAFIYDSIVDVPTGFRGADLLHKVKTPTGEVAGTLLWESKNTKAWQNDWLKKLKDDQAESKADLAVLASTTMPEGIDKFGLKDGVWVIEYRYAFAVAGMLRHQLLEVSKVQQSLEGREEKMNFLYQYLSGPQFKNRIENIVSAFESMKSDLDSEKRAMNRIWNKREKEIERVTTNTTGLYGDMQGIIALPTIERLELTGFDTIDDKVSEKLGEKQNFNTLL